MERNSRLSDNLRLYQKARGETLAEFSAGLGIARSTVQSVLIDGNTTVDTLVRMANALNVSLDELVFGASAADGSGVQDFVDDSCWFARLSPEEQSRFRYYLSELFKLVRRGV